MVWVCKKHGKNCDSYLKGIIDELNKKELNHKKIYVLVKWVEEAKRSGDGGKT